MEEFNQKPQTEKIESFVSIEESRKIAQELLVKYDSEITAQAFQDINGWDRFDGNGFEATLYQNAIDHYLREIPKETLEHYYGHGITRGRDLEWLTAALNILANESVRGDTSKLAGSGFIDAYTDGSFLAILEKDNPYPGGKPQRPNEIGLKINLGALVVNTKFYPLVDALKSMFPNKTIIKANEIPQYFEGQNEKENK